MCFAICEWSPTFTLEKICAVFPVSGVGQHDEQQVDGREDEHAEVADVSHGQHPEGDPVHVMVVAVDQLVDAHSLVDVQDGGGQVAANQSKSYK